MKETAAVVEPVTESKTTASIKDFILCLRPHQWSKNLLIFAPLIFAKELGSLQHVLLSIGAFLSFCLLSGAVYLINDVVDYKSDCFHPTKRNRPIASGRVSRQFGMAAGILLYITALLLSALLSWDFFKVALVYSCVTVGYTFWFKKVAILDVFAISIGFVLRAIAGGVAIHVPLSFYLLLCTFLLAMFLALSKRRHELVSLSQDATKHRENLAFYSPYLLDQMIGIMTATCVIAYTLYTVAPETERKFHTDKLSFTVPFVIFGIFRYLYLIHQEQGGGVPHQHLVSDKPLLVSIILWILTCAAIIYSSSFPWLP